MNVSLKGALVPLLGAVIAGTGTAVSGLDPTPYATEIGAVLGGLIAALLQTLRQKSTNVDTTSKGG